MFSIDETGKVTSTGTTSTDESGKPVLVVNDKPVHVEVKKTDIASGAEVAGAKLVVKDSTGKVVDQWTSTANGSNHVIKGLKTGEEYTLSETVAPDGYLVTTDITFTVATNGTVTTTGKKTVDANGNTVILVEDAITKVKVSKTDITNGDEELPGATLKILDAEGNEIKKWVSGTEPYYVEGLKTGVEYTLVEEIAPDGYTITSETKFSIDAETGRERQQDAHRNQEDGCCQRRRSGRRAYPDPGFRRQCS